MYRPAIHSITANYGLVDVQKVIKLLVVIEVYSKKRLYLIQASYAMIGDYKKKKKK